MEERFSVSKVVEDGLCVKCGTCVSVCPKNAIILELKTNIGTFCPKVDESICNLCGFCTESCPGQSVDFIQLTRNIFKKDPQKPHIGNFINCFIGYSCDNDIRYNSSSGGVITAMLIQALDMGIINGAVLTRMKKDIPLEPEPFIARTRQEIIEATGSKYCPVPLNIMVKDLLRTNVGEKFAIVGLPCHLHAIRKLEMINKKLKNKIVIHIGIICSKCPSFLATKYLLNRYSVELEMIENIKYRGGGYPGGMTIILKGGEEKNIAFLDYYDTSFGQFFSPIRCRLCIDFSAELADISVGDVFYCQLDKIDKIGSSLIIARSVEGEKFLSDTNVALNIKTESIEDFINGCKWNIIFKKSDIVMRGFLLGNKLPKYTTYATPKPNIKMRVNILFFLLVYRFGNKISNNKKLWIILRYYGMFIKYAGNLFIK